MAIRNLFQDLGQRVGRGLMEVGGYDPMQQVSKPTTSLYGPSSPMSPNVGPSAPMLMNMGGLMALRDYNMGMQMGMGQSV